MLFENLRAELKTKVAPAYIMTGTDVFLINKAIELILTEANVDTLNVVQLEEDITDDVINATLQNVSMFGGAVVAVIRGITESRVILGKHKKSEVITVDCNPMSESLVVKMILQNKKFTYDAAVGLARACENNYSRVAGEVEKLTCYCDDKATIDIPDVDKIVTKTERYQVFELSTALMKTDIVKVNVVLQNLESCDVDEYAVFASLLTFTKRLFYITNSRLSDGELAKHLGVHPYAIISTRRDGKWVDAKLSRQIYERALDYEFQIKSGKVLANRATVMLIGEMM